MIDASSNKISNLIGISIAFSAFLPKVTVSPSFKAIFKEDLVTMLNPINYKHKIK
jgi:hypothetical protein